MEISHLIAGRTSAEIISCETGASVRDVIGLLASRRIGALPVMQAGRVVGIFSERDVIYRMADEGAACLDRRVGEVMTSPPITVTPQTKVNDALSLMTRRRIRHLPVLEGEILCGFISIGYLVKSRMDQVEAEAAAMRDYIKMA